VIKDLEGLLSPYESMGWPVQALFPFVTGSDVIQSITGWRPQKSTNGDGTRTGMAPRMMVLAAELDVLCTPSILLDAATRYRFAFDYCIRAGTLDGISTPDLGIINSAEEWHGVTFKVVRGVAHHLQNHDTWEIGAEAVWEWTESL